MQSGCSIVQAQDGDLLPLPQESPPSSYPSAPWRLPCRTTSPIAWCQDCKSQNWCCTSFYGSPLVEDGDTCRSLIRNPLWEVWQDRCCLIWYWKCCSCQAKEEMFLVNKRVFHPVILGCVPLTRSGSRFFMQGTRVMVHQRNGVLVRRISYCDNRLKIREKGLNLELKNTQL